MYEIRQGAFKPKSVIRKIVLHYVQTRVLYTQKYKQKNTNSWLYANNKI